MDTLQGNREKWMIHSAYMNGLCCKQLKIYKSIGRGAISNWSNLLNSLNYLKQFIILIYWLSYIILIINDNLLNPKITTWFHMHMFIIRAIQFLILWQPILFLLQLEEVEKKRQRITSEIEKTIATKVSTRKSHVPKQKERQELIHSMLENC